jgi:apolipoprotein D and lipocalin family protein
VNKIVRNTLICSAALLAVMVVTAQTASPPPLQTVPAVDVDRYMGRWYQVALYPNTFQKQCARNTVATYAKQADGTVAVTNSCVTADGKTDDAVGQAKVVGPAKLKVSFLPAWLRWTGIGYGDYWVIQLPDDYRYAVVGTPSREYLWVLSRKPQLSAEDNTAIRAKLVEQGFDLARLQAHEQK